MNAATKLTVDLVRHESTPDAGSGELARYLADRLEDVGFSVHVHNYDRKHANVVAVLGDTTRPALCFSGHMDTVAVDASTWSVDPFGGAIKNGRVWGRGAADMKSGLAALLVAVSNHIKSHKHGPITVILTDQEELGCLGATALLNDASIPLPPVGKLVICEPTANRPQIGHRGAVWLDLEAKGRSCHASTPHLGSNAFWHLADSLRRVAAWSEANPSRHPVLGARTLNVGVVRAGTMRNIVPDTARAELDFRIAQTDDADALPSALETEVGREVSVRTKAFLPPIYSDPKEPWLASILGGAASEQLEAAQFFTDASVLTPGFGSPPTAILGPGSPDQAHIVDESCAVQAIDTAVGLYETLLHRTFETAS